MCVKVDSIKIGVSFAHYKNWSVWVGKYKF